MLPSLQTYNSAIVHTVYICIFALAGICELFDELSGPERSSQG